MGKKKSVFKVHNKRKPSTYYIQIDCAIHNSAQMLAELHKLEAAVRAGREAFDNIAKLTNRAPVMDFYFSEAEEPQPVSSRTQDNALS